jgi:hypothetical protein
MNRIIKFRAETKQSKLINGKGYSESILVYGIPNNVKFKTLLDKNGFHNHIKPETLSQFTGIITKNKIEIYENDILSNNNNISGIVKFKNGMFVVENNNESYSLYDFLK